MTTPLLRCWLFSVLVCAAGVCAAQELSATANERFRALDANSDGVLSKYEYDSDAFLTALDGDGNGRLSAAELQQILGPVEDGAVDAAGRIVSSDLDKDGELSDDELRRSLEFRYQWLDRNSDGNVDPAELAAGAGVPMIGGR